MLRRRFIAGVLSASLILGNLCAVYGAGLTNGVSQASGDVDSLVDSMPLKQKLEQMLMPAFRYWTVDGEKVPVTELGEEQTAFIADHNFGGVILFGENTAETRQTAELVNSFQSANAKNLKGTRIPYFVSIDQEGGRVARLKTGTSGVGNMALGAANSKSDTKEMAEIMGEELASLGINIDFAPVTDTNNNPNNPIIGTRSFSSDPKLVSEMTEPFIEGLHEAGVLTALKHFPGHGDTETDSHAGLPLITKSKKDFKEFELVPFQAGIDAGTDLIMTAHIQLPNIETETYTSTSTGEKINIPATMSKTVLTDILRTEMKFDGVIVTDALEMAAIADHFDPKDVIRLAINAGADLMLIPFDTVSSADLTKAEKYIDDAVSMVEDGTISESNVDKSVKRILNLKKKAGLLDAKIASADPDGAIKVVGSKEHHDKEWEIALKGITLIKNEDGLLPLSSSDKKKTLILASREGEVNSIKYGIQKLKDKGILSSDQSFSIKVYYEKDIEDFSEDIEKADQVLAVSRMLSTAWLDPSNETSGRESVFLTDLIKKVHEKGGKVAIISDGLPYDAARLTEADAILDCYCERQMTEIPDFTTEENLTYGPNIPAAVATAFGYYKPTGKLPVDIPSLDDSFTFTNDILYKKGTGLTFESKKDEPEKNVTKVSYDIKAVPGISINMVYTSVVSYNGKKHISNLDKVSKSKNSDLTVSIDSAVTAYADAKIKWKNNKDVPTNENKYPQFILSFKAKSGTATKEQKKSLKAINKELKKMPFRFDIVPQNLTYAKSIQVNLNGAKTKVKSAAATFSDGSTIKLKKKDFDAVINSDGSVTLKGKKNYSGEYTVK